MQTCVVVISFTHISLSLALQCEEWVHCSSYHMVNFNPLLSISCPSHLVDPQMCSAPGPACLTGGAAVQMMNASNAWRWPELQKEASMPSHVSSTTPTAPSAQVSTPCHSVHSPRANPDLSRNLGAQHTRVSGASSGSLCNNCNCLAERRGIIATSWCVSHRLMCVCGWLQMLQELMHQMQASSQGFAGRFPGAFSIPSLDAGQQPNTGQWHR